MYHTYCVPDTVLGTGKTAMSERQKSSSSLNLHSSLYMEELGKVDNRQHKIKYGAYFSIISAKEKIK